MPKKFARRYGHLVEERVRDKYGLIQEQTDHYDARYEYGRVVSIKGARATVDKRGHFRLFKRPYETLRRKSGWYVFAVYHPWGDTIRVTRTKRVAARDLDLRGKWYGSGRQYDSPQYKMPINEIFPDL